MRKITKTTQLPEPTQHQKVVVQVLTVGGWWATHTGWVTAILEEPTSRGWQEVAVETSEGKKMLHPWAQTKWSRVEAV